MLLKVTQKSRKNFKRKVLSITDKLEIIIDKLCIKSKFIMVFLNYW